MNRNAHKPDDLADDLADRFWPKTTQSDGWCIVWLGGKTSKGYGNIRNGDGWVQAHVAAWLLSGKSIPKGKVVGHTCRNRVCVRLDHLELVSQRDNIFLGCGPTSENSRKFECDHGHEFNRENTYIDPKTGTRGCRLCMKRHADNRKRRFRGRRLGKPDRDILAAEIQQYTFVALGEYYGVSDTAVRKWARGYGLTWRPHQR